ncbi:hypothetical protein CLV46_3265 [Diaminobutyricimonas aerilata]|uniref:Uncharacterized protein n=1 Tax=Diaminobutyricimonas aerilata TaxID=1162967 RepID=A0A2M9CP51_9MICO|nr:hypothetical protein [Diaminobutyricimonas aerilata]PJJ73669.1 hypothetical protein CLV46_3265 [Diaminobutyricimonas aerilata]
MRRALVTWGVVVAVLAAGFIVAVVALNATVYGAGGYVKSYLDALARHDGARALELARTAPLPEGSDALLSSSTLGRLEAIRQVADEDLGGGVHRVGFAFEVGGEPAEAAFTVRGVAPRFGLFSSWEFVESPLARVDLTVTGDRRFEVNGARAVTPSETNGPSPFVMFAPSSYEFAHESRYLTADPVRASVLPGINEVQLAVIANPAFVDEVQGELNAFLDECATQEVLQPTGCPFGKQIEDRVDGPIEWSMSTYPEVTIVPSDRPGIWRMPETAAAAHLRVPVRSIFDGDESLLDEDVPFLISFSITLQDDGGLFIQIE